MPARASKHLNIPIYVVDDSRLLHSMLSKILNERGYAFKSYLSPDLLLNDSELECQRSILITDYHMPVMTGIELINAFRQRCPLIRTILITSFGDKDVLLEAIQNQIDAFVQKPLVIDEFNQALEKVMTLACYESEIQDLIKQLSVKNKQLEEQKAQIDFILTGITQPILLVNELGTIEYTNESASKIIGVSSENLKNNSILPHLSDKQLLANFKRNSGSFEFKYPRKHGPELTFECHYSRYEVDGMAKFIVVLQDVSATKMREEFLEEQKYLLEEMVNQRTEDLTKAKEIAEKANAAKSDFLANMSHELRTPMHAILSFSSLIDRQLKRMDRAEAFDKIKNFAANINLSAQRLLKLLNNLLDLSKVSSYQASYAPAKYDIGALISRSISELESLTEAKAIQIVFEPPQGLLLYMDQELIYHVIINLLSNAVKFSPANSQICISLSNARRKVGHRNNDSMQDVVMIRVKDQGVGIPEDELTLIFEKFAQSSITNTGAGGTGLGLAICKSIINLHLTDIYAENNPDGGASFVFYLPYEMPADHTKESL